MQLNPKYRQHKCKINLNKITIFYFWQTQYDNEYCTKSTILISKHFCPSYVWVCVCVKTDRLHHIMSKCSHTLVKKNVCKNFIYKFACVPAEKLLKYFENKEFLLHIISKYVLIFTCIKLSMVDIALVSLKYPCIYIKIFGVCSV